MDKGTRLNILYKGKKFICEEGLVDTSGPVSLSKEHLIEMMRESFLESSILSRRRWGHTGIQRQFTEADLYPVHPAESFWHDPATHIPNTGTPGEMTDEDVLTQANIQAYIETRRARARVNINARETSQRERMGFIETR